jgi:hypothetical protein
MAKLTGLFQPRNALEHALVAAAADATRRGDFLRELLDATVVVVGDPTATAPGSLPGQPGARALKWGTMPDGRPCLPFYSSAEWLRGVVQRDVPILRLPARALFEGTAGATLALNLGAPLAKELTPDEVTNLLGGGGRAAANALGDPTRVVIGLPEVEPFSYLAAATTTLARHPEVRTAYLGWIDYPEAGTPPHLIIGIEGEGDLKDAMFDASAASDARNDPESLVDFVVVTRDSEGIAAWLWNNGRKFYEA